MHWRSDCKCWSRNRYVSRAEFFLFQFCQRLNFCHSFCAVLTVYVCAQMHWYSKLSEKSFEIAQFSPLRTASTPFWTVTESLWWRKAQCANLTPHRHCSNSPLHCLQRWYRSRTCTAWLQYNINSSLAVILSAIVKRNIPFFARLPCFQVERMNSL